jgi:hypothetical protein
MMADLSAETEGFMSVISNTIEADSVVHVRDRWYKVLVLITGAASKYVSSLEDERHVSDEFRLGCLPFRCVPAVDIVVMGIAMPSQPGSSGAYLTIDLTPFSTPDSDVKSRLFRSSAAKKYNGQVY